MTTEQLNHLLAFIKKTGDKAVVLDPASDEVFALLSLADYEQLLNSELPVAAPTVVPHESAPVLAPSALPPAPASSPATPPSTSTPPVKPALAGAEPRQESEFPAVHAASAPSSAPASAALKFSEDWAQPATFPSEESLVDVPEESEEEKFYPEPVE